MRNPYWPDIVNELVKKLGTQSALSERTGIPRASISSMSLGYYREPSYSRGAQLLELHKRICKQP